MLSGSAFLLVGSVLLGFIFATRRLDFLNRPLLSYGGSAIAIMLVGMALYIVGVIIWGTSTWIWGIGAIVVGFGILPSVFARVFTRLYQRA